jgi:hypothetical protein
MRISCALSIEKNESTFSLATRYCRVTDTPFSEMIGNAARFDRPALRDFPISVSVLERHTGSRFSNREKLFSEHSAALYFGVTLSQPFRSNEINASVVKVGQLLRLSLGSIWSHLRYCPHCARSEFAVARYSWWHRDHQLPLASVCAVHHCVLENASLAELGIRLPHELFSSTYVPAERKPMEFEIAIARLEQFLAKGEGDSRLKELVAYAKTSLCNFAGDSFDEQEIACARVKVLVKNLKQASVTEPIEDWDRLSLALRKFLRDGFEFSDPVAVVLFIVSANYPYLGS